MIVIILIKNIDHLNQYKWEARIKNNKALVQHGVIGGTITSDIYEFKSTKNTTANERCEKEIANRAIKKYENGYSFFEGENWVRSKIDQTKLNIDSTVPLPMLAKRYEKYSDHIKEFPYVFIQPKYDGNKCLVNIKTLKAYSKQRKEVKNLNHILSDIPIACNKLIEKNIEWIEGELYSHDLDFYEIQSALYNANSTPQLKLYVYDIIKETEWEVRQKLISLILETTNIKITETKKSLIKDLYSNLNSYLYDGYEGLIIRVPGSIYEHKKSKGLLKYKKFIDEECLVLDININEEKQCIKSLKVKDKNGTVFNTIPAFNNTITKDMYNNKNKYINKIATVKYVKRDINTNKPLHSKLIKFRNANDIDYANFK